MGKETATSRSRRGQPKWESEVLVRRFALFAKPDEDGNPTEEMVSIWLDCVTGVTQFGGYPDPYRLEVTFTDGKTVVVCGRFSDLIAEFGKVWVDCHNRSCPMPGA